MKKISIALLSIFGTTFLAGAIAASVYFIQNSNKNHSPDKNKTQQNKESIKNIALNKTALFKRKIVYYNSITNAEYEEIEYFTSYFITNDSKFYFRDGAWNLKNYLYVDNDLYIVKSIEWSFSMMYDAVNKNISNIDWIFVSKLEANELHEFYQDVFHKQLLNTITLSNNYINVPINKDLIPTKYYITKSLFIPSETNNINRSSVKIENNIVTLSIDDIELVRTDYEFGMVINKQFFNDINNNDFIYTLYTSFYFKEINQTNCLEGSLLWSNSSQSIFANYSTLDDNSYYVTIDKIPFLE